MDENLGKVSYVMGHIQVDLDLSEYGVRHELAQRRLAQMVLESCKPFMPMETGSLIERSYVSPDGKKVVFPGPYARYLYGGVVMVDSATGKGPALIHDRFGVPVGYRFRKGAILKPTTRPLSYSKQFNPKAQAHWYEAAKDQDLQLWVSTIDRIIKYGGGGDG